jgi:hypothetical protein
MALTKEQKAAMRVDHGTANQAIGWVIHVNRNGQEREFLECWQQGDLAEWPEFYRWLDKQPKENRDGTHV